MYSFGRTLIMSKTYFVTRHEGATEWARAEGHIHPDTSVVTTLDTETVQSGDTVIGTLPVHLAARVIERGGRYQHLVLNIGEQQRGRELTVDDMRSCGARIEELYIQRNVIPSPKSRESLHICIASAQTLPSLIPTLVPEQKPSAILILSSAQMAEAAARLSFGLTKSGYRENQVRILHNLPDHEFGSIVAYGNALIDTLRSDYSGYRWVLNATGGTKPMATALMQVLRPYAEVIYCDTDHDRIEVLHPPGIGYRALSPDLLNVEKYLAAQGFVIRDEPDRSRQLMQRRDLTRYLIENAPRLDNYFGKLNWAAYQFDDGKPHKAFVDRPSGGIELDIHDRLIADGLMENQGVRALIKPEAREYLGGGWLEEWCWTIGQELESGGMEHRLTRKRWGINLRIDPYDQLNTNRSRPTYSLNELDAAFVHRNRMLIVECKTGTQLSEKGKSQDILNKLEVLGEHTAGKFSTKWLLSARTVPSGQILERAQRYRINIVPPNELVNLKAQLQKWMTPR
jgi:putative CRISPR-associated protein (TIGR02620 family)